jgi:integrase
LSSDLDGKLKQVNGRLKASKVGVTVEKHPKADTLRLRATLPPKPGSAKREPYQQRISLNLPANPAGLRQAEKQARLLGAQLAARDFDWQDWGVTTSKETWNSGSAIDALKEKYLAEGGTLGTWNGDYWKALKKLPPEAKLTADVLETMVLGTKANTRTRVRAATAASALAKFAGIDFDIKRYRGNYSPSKVSPRDLPGDAAIATVRNDIQNPAWRWVYGIMATYGLRNHEVFHLDMSDFPRIQVLEKTKTGAREVWPCFPEWATEWGLDKVLLPPVELDRSNQALGHSVTRYLSPLLPFQPYDLRHAWAIRTMAFGWPVELSARQMGHSVEIHTRTYQRWITRQQIQATYDLLVNRSDRPLPP